MKIAHVTIQTDKFDEEVRFYEEQTELKVQRDMRPAGTWCSWQMQQVIPASR